jgi:glycosyltransferase involved in cell wall biosynthesis
MSASASNIGKHEVLWIGGYPAHYTRAMHCEIERLRPGTVYFLYVVDEKTNMQRAYEQGGMPDSTKLLSRVDWLSYSINLVKSKPKLVILAGYGNRFTNFALLWFFFTRLRFCFWSDTNLLDVLGQPNIKQFFRKLLLKPLLSRATLLLYIGSRNRDYWIWLLGKRHAQKKLYHMAYPALLMHENATAAPTCRQDAEKFTIISLCRLEPVKAVDKLLKAVSLLGPDYQGRLRLDIYGTGSEEKNLIALASKLGLEKTIIFHGAIPSDQVAQAYARADLFVLPSNIEPWGLVVNEALSEGVPVICPYWVGAAADLVLNGLTGYVMENNEPSTIAAAIERAWCNRNSLASFGERGRELVRNGPWNCDMVTLRLLHLVDVAIEIPQQNNLHE